MMSKVKWAILIGFTVALLLFGSTLYSQYKPDPSLYGFPVPNLAVLTKEHNTGKNFEWSRASEENGIPFDYEMSLKLRGWKKGEREGAAVVYTKDQQVITLISQTDILNVLKTPLR
ncbi:hypothetical protein ACFOZY_12310 [Chungangia koreensis]|uniref:Uncharacterized protein n=1 Tax=Chungangia koreensis TaxID=752657 RepID=A0ABV8X871_9LACT